MCLIEFLVLFSCGSLAGQATHLATSPRFTRLTNSGAGLMLVGVGVGLATIRYPFYLDAEAKKLSYGGAEYSCSILHLNIQYCANLVDENKFGSSVCV